MSAEALYDALITYRKHGVGLSLVGARTATEAVIAAGYVSPEDHAEAVREARAEGWDACDRAWRAEEDAWNASEGEYDPRRPRNPYRAARERGQTDGPDAGGSAWVGEGTES